MKIILLFIAAFLASITQFPSSFVSEVDIFLNVVILLGAGAAAYVAGSL